MKYLAPLEGPPDPNSPHVTVDCDVPGCRISFFVDKTHPLLPDGPWICLKHSDTAPVLEKTPDYVIASVSCDQCSAELSAEGPTREIAVAKVRAVGAQCSWRIADGIPGERDLCSTCAG